MGSAIIEGLADAVASIYSDEHDLAGEDWVAGEHIFDDPNNPKIRDLRENQFLDDLASAPSLSPQENGKTIANAIYRLKVKGVSNQDLLKVVIDVATNINKNGGADGLQDAWDIEDFKEAMQNAGDAIGSAVGGKVEDVLEDMTLPPAQVGLVGIPFGCMNGKLPVAEVTFHAGSGGGHVDDFDVDKYENGHWAPWYEGVGNCVLTGVSQTGTDFRARGINEAGPGVWVQITVSSSCAGGGGGPIG